MERIDQRGSRQVLYRTELPQTKKSGSGQAATDATPESRRQRRACHAAADGECRNSYGVLTGTLGAQDAARCSLSVCLSVRAAAAAETLVLRRVCRRSLELSVELPSAGMTKGSVIEILQPRPTREKKNWNGTSIRELEPAVREEKNGSVRSGQVSRAAGTRRGPTASAAPPTAMGSLWKHEDLEKQEKIHSERSCF